MCTMISSSHSTIVHSVKAGLLLMGATALNEDSSIVGSLMIALLAALLLAS